MKSNYPLSAEDNLKIFEFISEGPNGLIKKMVQFTPTNLHGFYILALGDKDSKTGELDDLSISNNNDTERILATVAAVLILVARISTILFFLVDSISKL